MRTFLLLHLNTVAEQVVQTDVFTIMIVEWMIYDSNFFLIFCKNRIFKTIQSNSNHCLCYFFIINAGKMIDINFELFYFTFRGDNDSLAYFYLDISK